MKVGILGSGIVGQTLASGFLKFGHQVMIGTRDEGKLANWLAAHPNGRIGSFEQTANGAALIVLAVKGAVAAQALGAAGEKNLSGKTVIDATNPIADLPPQKGILKFFTTLDNSLMEQLQRAFPSAHLVKAFNSVGAARMVNPQFRSGRPTMFICGNDESAKRDVTEILAQFGWDTADMGAAEAARAIEPLGMLWCIPGFARNEWSHAFALLRD